MRQRVGWDYLNKIIKYDTSKLIAQKYQVLFNANQWQIKFWQIKILCSDG